MLRFSVIVPVFAQPDLLEACLASIRASEFSDYELIVSDDGSPDETSIRDVAARHGARLVRSAERRGSAAARNRAAAEAEGEALVFFDADVTVSADTLARLAEAFDRTPSPDAVIGSYDHAPDGRNRASHFRNLLHTHAHQRSRPEATTFWTGCGAIRRRRFLLLGGFKESFARPSIEDVELGLRLHRSGGRIFLDPRIQVKHHKDWTVRQMLHTDLAARAMPWAALIREHGLPSDLNFRASDRVAVALAALALPLLAIALLHGMRFAALLAADLAAIVLLQSSLLRFLAASKGVPFAITSFPLLFLYDLVCAAGLIAGLLRAEMRRDRWFLPAAGTCAVLIIALQIAGGAYRAEFDGTPDESAQFVSSLMVYDYINAPAHQSPLRWAEEYYLHYPKVGIGHWPPLFFVLQAGWWLLFAPSRASAIGFNATLLVVAAMVFYHRLRDLAPAWIALSMSLLLLAVPIVQQSAGQSMAEAMCLLWGVLLLDAMVRLVRRPSLGATALAALWLSCAILTKGTGFSLAAAPLLALALARKWGALFHRRTVGFAAVVMLVAFFWYGFEYLAIDENIRGVAGLGWSFPSPLMIARLAGYGFLFLAFVEAVIAVVRPRPHAIAPAAILISVLGTSLVLGAMRESRHFIIILPAILFLAVEAASRAPAWLGWVLLLSAGALAPLRLYRQQPAGFAAIAAGLPTGTRSLVSSSVSGEGAWIAEVALREQRPSSYALRATKILSASDWNGNGYELYFHSPEEVARRLDELAIDLVIVDSARDTQVAPHRALLDQTMRSSASWSCSARSATLTVCHRVRPPEVPRRPIEIDMRGKIGTILREP